MRLVPVDFGTPQLAARQADHGDALSLRHRPRPWRRLSRESWRMDVPTAILSMLVIGNDLEVHDASSLRRSQRTRR
jgi:hypothetical protein